MKRYVIVGASFRCYTMFVENLLDYYPEHGEITGIYDLNKTRCEVFKKRVGQGLTIYDDFENMLDLEKPDAVIVTTTDAFHHEYIIRALNKGYDVITEKPITNTYEKCLAIREAEKKSGKKVTVTFNCRFMPAFVGIKEIVASGKIGKILSINYEYFLNRWHGGDYFKRWHRLMENSGGMLVHKSTHHFDVMNWILEDEPVKVSALGNRVFYGDQSKSFATRCKDCPKQSDCQSYKSQTVELDNELYFGAEHEDGYIRDKCCYLPDTNIYDNMSVSVLYKGGAILTYSLNLFSLRGEGSKIVITGEKGVIVYEGVSPSDNPDCAPCFKVFTDEGKFETYPLPVLKGRHGGADPVLVGMLFAGENPEDKLGQCADSFAGIVSALIGISANESIANGVQIDLAERIDKIR